MAQNVKFVEIKAYSKDEAMEKAPCQIMMDATLAWKSAGSPIMGADFKEFAAIKLKKETKLAPGLGCIVVLDAGIPDGRKYPYAVTDIINKDGARKFTMSFELVDKATGKILGIVTGATKIQAIEKAKKLYTEQDFKGDIVAKYIKVVTDGEPRAFEVNYAPSERTHLGNYLVFYVDND